MKDWIQSSWTEILLQFRDVIPSLSLFAKVKIKLIQNNLNGDFVLKLKLQYLQQITSCEEEILAFADNWQSG